ncbi:molybdopterin-synthase adenylyltransferase MoeB [Exilibacterium tricleocarpae]|uniref:Molybdopterin-synthase adenylyltransferase n=1 Tax=Exilibacterium tricleocarpae TaxID=2591008 RepID=A0A545U451_9GAMM|nr:molybdopterin-synthase adenylyltransferase MoeB [Exilibacterium tricleocarpae]TQV84267.1 molybdopterin-synthase adenylyltransferase MoeB [Exilibacterium tricleocarpae]
MAETFTDLLDRLKKDIPAVSVDQAAREVANGNPVTFLDVRETDERQQGCIAEAVHLPRGFLELKVESIIKDRTVNLIVYCASGTRSVLAASSLLQMGYTRVRSMSGGFNHWKESGNPVKIPMVLSTEQRKRYDRHLRIPEVGEQGQIKLLESQVLLIGAGGLGSPSAYYLAAAGIGKLGIVDFDKVEASNLQRQILHRADSVGEAKVKSACKTLTEFNPGISIEAFEERLTPENVERIMTGYDVVVDGSDNFPTRYLINDACLRLKIPCVHGSVFRFEGQVSVLDPARGGPCYRCMHAEPPPPELAPSCADAGVLGVLPGVIGLLQAVEAIKIVLDKGESLIGRLLQYDAMECKFREFQLHKDPTCRYCSTEGEFPGYMEYQQFCGDHN